MSNSAINTQVAQLKIGNVQNQADNSAVYSGGIWSLKNSTAVTSVTITDAGNVGIGTSSPTNALDIRRAVGIGAAITISASGRTPGTNNLELSQGTNGEVYFWNRENASMLFATNNAERMRIDASGNLLVGRTDNNGNGRLNALASSSSTAAIVSGSASPGDVSNAVHLFYKNDNNSTTSQVFCRFAINNNGATSGQINANGANAVAFGTWSDRRLKENISDLQPQLVNILALRPVEFDYISSEGGGHQIGFIAQEMQTIYADSVGERADGMLTVSGWDKTAARLVKAIQELSAKVDAQAAEIEALKAK